MKVLIVGGGFSGLLLARLLGEHALVFEEHPRIGFPEHCTGLISYKTYLNLKIPQKLVEGSYKKLRINIPKIGALEVKLKEPVLRVNRYGIEEYFYNEALSRGSRIILSRTVRNVNPFKGIVDEVKGELVILAEGVKRYFSKRLGLVKRINTHYSLQLRFKGRVHTDAIEVYVTKLSPNFFSWLIPLYDGEEGIIGVTSPHGKDLYLRLNILLDTLTRSSLIDLKERKYYFGGVVSTGPLGTLGVGKLLAIGDTIGMNKPLSGGGLYPISVAASTLSNIIEEYCNGLLKGNEIVNEYKYRLRPLIRELNYSYIISKIIRLYDYKLLRTIVKGSTLLNTRNVFHEFEYDAHSMWVLRRIIGCNSLRIITMLLAGLLF